ncbi:MAG: GntR family transcriptional regulator [Actinomycetaceae bacterium]|nr:GntR family transcriptional regulator [Actinomycetaceae bacterium]
MGLSIAISQTSSTPIYQQIVDQVREQILGGRLTAGETMPSLRALARDCRCSLITTTRAYSDLVAEGLLINQPGRGYIVAALDVEVQRQRAWADIHEHLEQVRTIAARADITTDELLAALGNDNKAKED